MTIEAALFSTVTSAATMAALIAARFYPVKAPAGAGVPYGTYQHVSDRPDRSFAGPVGPQKTRFRMQWWAGDPDAAWAVANAARTLLDTHRGLAANGVDIRSIAFETATDTFDDPVALFRVAQDYFVTYCE